MDRHCRRCGRTNRSGAAFCDACGTQLAAPAERAESAGVTSAGEIAAGASGSFTPEVFVGRQAEMSVLQAGLEDALASRGRLVFLVGEPGIGKTRLAREFSTHASARGALVLWGRCYERRGAPPYWPWVQIIRAYMQEHDAEQLRTEMGTAAANIANMVPEIRDHLPDLRTPPPIEDPEQARFRLFDALTTFLLTITRRRPLVCVLDNLHWADTPSLLLLEFLIQEGASSRMLVVGTYRDEDISRQHPLSELLAEVTRQQPLTPLQLHGLSRQEVGEFITSATARVLPEEVAEGIYTQTEGNPLFLTEMLGLLLQEGEWTPQWSAPGFSLPMKTPTGVRAVIGKRLNRLSPPCNQILTVASVIGREFTLEEVSRLVDNLTADHVLLLLEEAVRARIIEEASEGAGTYQFTHALIRATLYDELTTAHRVRLHLQIGDVLEELYQSHLDPHAGRLAYHFGEAAQGGDVERAIVYAVRAGAWHGTLLAYEEAIRYYEMALGFLQRHASGEARQRCELLLALGKAQRQAGHTPQALNTFQQAAEMAKVLDTPETLAHAALGFEETSWRPGLPGNAAAQLLQDALVTLEKGDSLLKARLLGQLARALAFTGAFDQAAGVEKQAVEMARRLGDPATLATVLRALFYVRRGPQNIATRLANATELIALAQAVGDQDALQQTYSWRLFDLLDVGDMPAVEVQLAAHTRLAETLRQPYYLYINMTFRAMWAIFVGHFDAGEQLTQQAFAIGQRLRGLDALGVYGVQMFTLRREQGRLQELAAAVRHFVDTSPQAATWRPGLALIYSELGLAQEARAQFEMLAANNFTDIPQDASWVTCIAYLAEVGVFLRDHSRAALLYELLLPYDGYNITIGPTAACYGAASRYLGLLATTMRRWQDAQRHFEAALTMNARMGARPWLAHTQVAYANMLVSRGQPADREHARALRDAALSISRELGMHALTERAEALGQDQDTARPSPDVSPYPAGLTTREVEVLRLIAAGKSNRDIAEALYISPNTVANHVRNILTKTTTANRTEAAAYAVHYGLLAD